MKKFLTFFFIIIGGLLLAGCQMGADATIMGTLESGQLVCNQKSGDTNMTVYDFGAIKSINGNISLNGVQDCKTVLKLKVSGFTVDSYQANSKDYTYDEAKIGESVIVKSDDKKITLKNIGDEITLYCNWDVFERYGEWDNCRLVK